MDQVKSDPNIHPVVNHICWQLMSQISNKLTREATCNNCLQDLFTSVQKYVLVNGWTMCDAGLRSHVVSDTSVPMLSLHHRLFVRLQKMWAMVTIENNDSHHSLSPVGPSSQLQCRFQKNLNIVRCDALKYGALGRANITTLTCGCTTLVGGKSAYGPRKMTH